MRAQTHLLPACASLLSAAALLLALGGPAAAQLANGPWSMYRHDVCHTGQSPSRGPLTPKLDDPDPTKNQVTIWHGFDKLRTSPSLSKDGKTIFFGMGFKFCSIDITDTLDLRIDGPNCLLLHADVSDSAPAVGADGTVYMGDRDNSLNAYTITIDPDTKVPVPSLKWRVVREGIVAGYNNGREGDIWQSPVIAPASLPAAGTIYFTHDQSYDGAGIFTALLDQPDPVTGLPYKVKWKYKIGNAVKQSSPVIDDHGIIYFGDLAGYVYAFADKGACMDKPSLRAEPPLSSTCTHEGSGPVLLWRKQVGTTPGITASPVISADSNTLYIGTLAGLSAPGGPQNLTALDISIPCPGPPAPPCAGCACSQPPVRWTAPKNIGDIIGKVDQTPALGRDGTLYVPTFNMGQGRLYAITPGATNPKWVFPKSTAIPGARDGVGIPPYIPVSEISGQPIVGGDGTVYVGLGKNIYALNSLDGTLKWTYATTNYIQSSPLIGPVTGGKAHLYVPSRDNNLYDIWDDSASTLTPTTCWTEGATGPPPPPVNQAPIANAGADQKVPVSPTPTSVTLDGSGSSDPDPLDTLTYTWDFGDGSPVSHLQKPSHPYATANPGVYTAMLTVKDNHGAESSPAFVHIEVTAAGSGTFFRDNFNTGTALQPPWKQIAGVPALVISAGKLKNPDRDDYIAIVDDLSGEIQSASAYFTDTSNNSGPRLGLVLRVQDAKNYYRLYRWAGGTNELRISKVFNGGETVLKKWPVALPAEGTPFQLKGSANGPTLTLTLVGGASISATDPTYTSGKIGVLINPGGQQTFHAVDDFCASIDGTCP